MVGRGRERGREGKGDAGGWRDRRASMNVDFDVDVALSSFLLDLLIG